MTDPYAQYADIFMSSMAGKASGLTKEQFISRCKAQWPTQIAFLQAMATMEEHASMLVEQANLKNTQQRVDVAKEV